MKKTWIALCLLPLLLTGCGRMPGGREAWPEDWIVVGGVLGIQPPGNGLTLLDNKDALAASNLYYAAWVMGEKAEYVNADEETVDLYDAQLYLLLENCGTAQKAASKAAAWQSMETQTYEVEETLTVICSDQEFTILSYSVDREGNPYARGASAFGVCGNHAVNIELACVKGFDNDPLDILTEFMDGIRYNGN